MSRQAAALAGVQVTPLACVHRGSSGTQVNRQPQTPPPRRPSLCRPPAFESPTQPRQALPSSLPAAPAVGRP